MHTPLESLRSVLASRYHVERELGGGGMSRVFLAREHALHREVVIKVLLDDVAAGVSLERFAREIQLAASLQQANIVPLLSAGDADGTPYFTMPYVEGESLRRRLSQGTALSIGEAVSTLRDVGRALSYAHARGVVHRDIKPDNVLLSHGTAMVTDFGIAKAVSVSRVAGDRDTLTQVGTSVGTPAYMAPEQVAGDPNVDHRADLYAWGCLAYELLTGQPPFVRDSPQRTLAAHLSESPVPLAERRSDVPAALALLVARCLAKEPAERPPNADAILADLDAVLTPGDARTAGRVRTGVSTRWRRRLPFAAVAVTLILVAAAVTQWSSRRPQPPAPGEVPDRSIAVLPLSNLSGDKSDDYFGIGLAEEMTRALSRAGMRVIGRVSAGALLARGLDERAVARELGVGSLLTGSVQRADGQLRINVALLSASDGAVRWTEKYDRPIANIFAVQDEIARSVAEKLIGSFAGPARTRRETSDPEAHALLLQGQVHFNRRTAPAMQQAISLLRQASSRDPGYARAHAALAMAYAALPFYVPQDMDSLSVLVRESAARAIAIDATIPESYTAAGYVHAARAENGDADRLFRRALALDSTAAMTWAWHGLLALHMGDFATAHARVARARELEPASLVIRAMDAQIRLNERRFAAADSAARQILGLDSTFALAWTARAEALLGLGRADEAVAILERRVSELPLTPPSETQGMLVYAYARATKREQAHGLMNRLRAAAGGELPAMGILAAALDQLGDTEGGVALLARAIAAHDPWLLQFNRAERYDRLRADRRGAALLATIERP